MTQVHGCSADAEICKLDRFGCTMGHPMGCSSCLCFKRRAQLLLGLAQAGPESQECKQELCGPCAVLLVTFFL